MTSLTSALSPVPLSTEPELMGLLYAYLGGFLSSLTPCVYPIIPITLSTVGARGATSRLESFGHSALYVGGMIATYTTLGVLSARAGSLFGSTLQSPVFLVPFALLLVFLALNELDIISIKTFSRFQQIANKIGGGGSWLAIFMMGGASGLVAAPCIGPILASILGVAASTGSGVWGGALLFSYSLGLGTIFLLLGTFSHLINRLPRSGQWLNLVKSVLGVSLLVLALLFVRRWLPFSSLHWSTAVVVAASCLIGLTLITTYRRKNHFLRLISAFGCAVVIAFGISAQPRTDGTPAPPLNWSASLKEALDQGIRSDKPVFVDFFAEWCGACKQIDSVTLPDPAVREELANHWVIARIEMTNQTDEGQALQQQYGIQGLPTILFFAPGSTAPHPVRVTEFIDADGLMTTLRKIRGDS